MVSAFIYIRFSTPKQEAGSSKDRQIEDCRAYLDRQGWDEAEVIGDLGISAWKGNHLRTGNLGKFAQRVIDGEIPRGSVLVVQNLDRLSRQEPRKTQRWMEDMWDAGLRIASVRDGKVYDAENLSKNIMDIFDVLYKAKAANDYVEVLSSRVKRSYDKWLEQARLDGTPIGNKTPAWIRTVGMRPDLRFELIPERMVIVWEIFKLTIDGKPPWAIARAFNERGEKSFTGKAWERTAIVKIIGNPAIEGDHVVGEGKRQTPTGEILHGYYPVAIPADVVAQARAALARRKLGPGRSRTTINNLFGQKIRCGGCGGRMMTAGYQSRYLVCYEGTRGNGCELRTAFRYRPFEKAALDSILNYALDETFFREAAKANHLTLEIAQIEKALKDKRAEAERLVGLLSRIESPTTEAKLAETEHTIGTLTAKLNGLVDSLCEAQGAASTEAHIERVHGVREALEHPDEEIRVSARARVAEALQKIVAYVDADLIDGERRFELGLVGAAGGFRYDNFGNLLGEVRGNLDAVKVETQGEAAPLVRRMKGWKKRA